MALSRRHWLDAPPVKLDFDALARSARAAAHRPAPAPILSPEEVEQVRAALRDDSPGNAPAAAPTCVAAAETEETATVVDEAAAAPVAPADETAALAPDLHAPDDDPSGGADAETAATAGDLPPESNGCRPVCNTLGLFLLCARAACRKARSCRGKPEACLGTFGPQVPEPVRLWVLGLLEARDRKLPFENARAEVAQYEDAYACWIEGLAARDARRTRGGAI